MTPWVTEHMVTPGYLVLREVKCVVFSGSQFFRQSEHLTSQRVGLVGMRMEVGVSMFGAYTAHLAVDFAFPWGQVRARARGQVKIHRLVRSFGLDERMCVCTFVSMCLRMRLCEGQYLSVHSCVPSCWRGRRRRSRGAGDRH